MVTLPLEMSMSAPAPRSRSATLADSLTRLTGMLAPATPADTERIEALREALARVLIHQDVSTIANRPLSIDASDLHHGGRRQPAIHDALEQLAQRVAAESGEPEARVFMRDVPVRTSRMAGSVPAWAAGAAVEKTLGPFASIDGRSFWFDFFRITRLVGLYVQGHADPAILFNVSTAGRLFEPDLPLPANAAQAYQLVPDSVWINAPLLAKNAPAGTFVGLKITGGTIRLDHAPQVVTGKLTLAPGTRMDVTLDLDSRVAVADEPASPYGIDARQATLTLPTRLSFHVTNGVGAIDALAGAIGWRVYGDVTDFRFDGQIAPTFEPLLNRMLVPLMASVPSLTVRGCASPFVTLAGAAPITRCAWALPVAQLDVAKPSPAAGIGGIAALLKQGLSARWQGLKGGSIGLASPWLLADPGRLNLTDLAAGNVFCTQEYRLWADASNPFRSSVMLRFKAKFPFVYNSFADGNEAFLALTNANPLLDRPVTITGLPFDIRSADSTLIVAVSQSSKLVYLFDDNILLDNQGQASAASAYAALAPSLALALRNALFKVTPVNGCLLFGSLADDMRQVDKGAMFLTVGVYAYVPTLPDPYAANLGALQAQFERVAGLTAQGRAGVTVWLWLVARTQWQPLSTTADEVGMSFHFAPLQEPFAGTAAGLAVADDGDAPAPALPATAAGAMSQSPFARLLATPVPAVGTASSAPPLALYSRRRPPDYQTAWDDRFGTFFADNFALLDVSSNANQMGVSFAWFGDRQLSLVRTHQVVADAGAFPLQVQGVDVVSQARNVRAFTTPVVSWEPVINLTQPEPGKSDPPQPVDYYPDDGGPTRIVNNSVRLVPIAPISVCEMLVDAYRDEPGNVTAASFTLPFGMRAIAYLFKTDPAQATKPIITFNAPTFANDLVGGLQLKLVAGSGIGPVEDNLFRGYTLQMNNVLDTLGNATGTTTLGEDVVKIFNGEFFQPPGKLDDQRGVPLKRIDLSGYGASTFSDWSNPDARFAATSQARFEVMVGRTTHEVVQVRSIVYPWGIGVVRTVTLFRVGSGYVYRVDSGWKAQTDGVFDFRFRYVKDLPGYLAHRGDPGFVPDDPKYVALAAPYLIHPGTLQGLFNVHNIRTAVVDVLPFTGTMDVSSFYHLDPSIDRPVKSTGGEAPVLLDLEPIWFDADVALEGVVQGQVGGRVPARRILGFVQTAPRGIPITPTTFQALLLRQAGSIGGPLKAVMDIGNTGQKLRVDSVDVNASVDAAGTTPVFAAAARGQVVLPKDGSWSLVSHARGTGAVTPLPDSTSAPLVRVGQLAADMSYPDTGLLRIANPADLLRAPGAATLNYGFLQSTNTQKVLFLTPAFAKQASSAIPGKLLSRTPPLFVDAYRLAGSKAVFPNIGDAETAFGSAIALTQNFKLSALADGGKKVLELMHINSADGVGRAAEDGYRLANAVRQFALPNGPWYLVNEDYLKIYVEYQATTDSPDPNRAPTARAGLLDYDVDSFAGGVADRWKSRINNMAMVADLGPFTRLFTIKGNFDAKKGSEAGFVGDPADPDFPTPQLELSNALEKAKDILQVLAALSDGDYVEAFKRGLKVAMSNGADSWDYKFEASQEIPVLHFPPGPFANDPNAPMKLEASLRFGVYFNSSVGIAAFDDPKKLLPTAGAFIEFYGRMSVMCVSLSIATVYAVGQVNLRIAGDTGVGPVVDMKFGFGAQLVVGLPLVGNVSVLYMIGVEIYADSKTMSVSAFLLYQGHAELIAGLVSITISIEAKGSVERLTGPDRTVCAAQVTFAIDISIFLVIDIDFSKSWQEDRQIA